MVASAMNQFLEMDIFFLITTIVVIATGAALAFVLVRIWKILGHVERISRDVSEESALLRSDIDDLRTNIREEGFKAKHIAGIYRSTLGRFAQRKRKREE